MRGGTSAAPAVMSQATVQAAPTARPAAPSRVFSGIQPSGPPHLGNYLGMVRNAVAMQQTHEAIYCIVDYHALTSTHDPEVIHTCRVSGAEGASQ